MAQLKQIKGVGTLIALTFFRSVGAKQSRNISQQKLTIELDLGDRNSWYFIAGLLFLYDMEQENGQSDDNIWSGVLN